MKKRKKPNVPKIKLNYEAISEALKPCFGREEQEEEENKFKLAIYACGSPPINQNKGLKMLDNVIEFVEKSLENSTLRSEISRITDIGHAKNTHYWVLGLYPQADVALQIAGLMHDLDRAFIERNDITFMQRNKQLREEGKPEISYDDYKAEHEKDCARIAVDFLIQRNYDPLIIEKVGYLIGRHEIGGCFESEVLKTADAISFLDNNFNHYFNKYKDKEDMLIKKVKWTMNRLKEIPFESLKERALQEAEPFYQRAMGMIEEYQRECGRELEESVTKTDFAVGLVK